MARRCELNLTKGVMCGNNVSHSNRKTRRRFLPNIQTFSLKSDALNSYFSFEATPHSIKSVEQAGGIDSYLLKTCSSKLGSKAKTIKRKLQKAAEEKVAVQA